MGGAGVVLAFGDRRKIQAQAGVELAAFFASPCCAVGDAVGVGYQVPEAAVAIDLQGYAVEGVASV